MVSNAGWFEASPDYDLRVRGTYTQVVGHNDHEIWLLGRTCHDGLHSTPQRIHVAALRVSILQQEVRYIAEKHHWGRVMLTWESRLNLYKLRLAVLK